MRVLVSLLLLLLIFIPTSALAQSVTIGSDSAAVSSRDGWYRFKNQRWQLAENSANKSAKIYKISNIYYFLTPDSVFRSTDLLAYEVVLKSESVLELVEKSEDYLLLKDSTKFYYFSERENIAFPLHGKPLMTWYNGELLTLEQNDSLLKIFKYNSVWLNTDSLECANAVVAKTDTGDKFVLCESNEIYTVTNTGFFQTGVTAHTITGSSKVVAAAEGSYLKIFEQGQWRVIDLTEHILSVTILGDRVFVKTADDILEIDYINKVTYSLGPESELINGNEYHILLVKENANYYSAVSGKYTLLPKAFDSIVPFNSEAILYSADHDQTVKATQSSYAILTDSWAASARIKSMDCNQYCLALINNSAGNPNVYLLEESNWKRITLPTKETLVRSVSQARQLTAGSLVELSGVVAVEQGLVAKEVAYISDGTTGIQLFLSSTKGTIPYKVGDHITVNAELSSSFVKRLLLSAITDLASSSGTINISTKAVKLADMRNYISIPVEATVWVKSKSASAIEITDNSVALKIKPLPDQDFTLGAQYKLKLLFDSLSDGELSGFQLSEAELVASPPEIAKTNLSAAQATKTAAPAAKSSISPKSTSTPTISQTNQVNETNRVTDGEQENTLVASATSNTKEVPMSQAVAMTILGLLSGLLISIKFSASLIG